LDRAIASTPASAASRASAGVEARTEHGSLDRAGPVDAPAGHSGYLACRVQPGYCRAAIRLHAAAGISAHPAEILLHQREVLNGAERRLLDKPPAG
jgi:hypothetical protein